MKKTLFTLFMAWLISIGAFAQLDVTDKITNPSFEEDPNESTTITGWINNGFQTQKNNEFNLKVGDFYCEKWTNKGENLGDASITQTIEIENGTYTLKVVGGLEDQTESGPTSGMYFIANEDSVKVTDKKQYSLETEVTDGTLTLQVVLSNVIGNYAYFDHFILQKNVDYPLLNVSDTEFTFDEEINTGSFVIEAANLTEDITITAPEGFAVDVPTINKDNAASTTVTVTFDGQADATGDIVVSTAGVDDLKVSLTGEVKGYECIFTPYYETGNLVHDPYMSSLDGFAGWGGRAISTDPAKVYCGGTSYVGTDASLDINLDGKLEGGALYILRAMIKTDGTFNIGSYNGMHAEDQILYTGDTQGEWQLIEATFVPDGEDGSLYINGYQISASEICVDNFEIYKLLPSDDATLSALSVVGYELKNEFSPTDQYHVVEVPFGVNSVTLKATPSDPGSTIEYFDTESNAYSDGIITFPDAGITILIRVTSSSGIVEDYYLDINVDDPRKDATLQGIDLSVSAIDPAFDKEVKTYTAVVPVGTATVDVTGIPTFEGATIAGDGTLTLVDGTVSTTIVVTSADGNSSNNYTLTIAEADGSNYALSLPGSNGQNSNVALTGANLSLMPFTIEMWIKPDGDQGENAALIYNATNNIGLEYNAANQLRFISNAGEGGDNGGSAISATVTPNAWHHVAVIVTDSTRTMYLDGAAVTESAGIGAFSTMDFTAEGLHLGWDSNEDGNVFKGLMDEVRIWDNALSTETLTANKYTVLNGDEADLLAYYNFDVNSANNAFDASTGAEHGIITGATYAESFPRANLELSSLTIEGATLYPDYAYGVTEYFATLPIGSTSVNVQAVAVDNNTTLTGTGAINVDDKGTIVVTATNGEYSLDYVIKYVVSTELTLAHSYTFIDGTAKDVIGNANGMLHGDGYIKEGVYYADVLNSYISFPGDSIQINTYPSLTLELFTLDTDSINPNLNTMITYLGAHNDWTGVDGIFFSAKDASNKCRAAVSCLNYIEPWTTETGVEGPIIGEDGEEHHVVVTMDNDSLMLYVDGTFISASQLSDANKVYNLSNDVAYLFKSGYSSDNTWLGAIYEYNIYKGVMDKETVDSRYKAQITDEGVYNDNTTDATLSEIIVDTAAIAGFNPTYMEYTVEVPYGSTTVPTITATAKVEGAVATVTKAESIGEATTIVVVSKDGNYSNTYTINLVEAPNPADATLNDLLVDGTTISNFAPETLKYSIKVDAGAAVPTITATATNPKAWITITAAKTLSDTTFIVVMPEDSSATMTYEVTFEEAAALDQTKRANISVVPTVSNGQFTVKTDGSLSTITVYSLSGVVVKQLISEERETTFSLDKSQMYLVSVTNNRERQIFRILKK